MIDLIDSFHTVDPRWQIWNVHSYQDFANKFMITGKFHSNVPSEIVKDYQIVERLLCYSYYSYDLLDEAFSKVTRIFESAVKLRMEQLGIIANKNESLNNRLKKLENQTSPELFNEWKRTRKARNFLAHPQSGQLLGITIHRRLLQMVNVINTLFLDKEVIDKNDSTLKKMESETTSFNNGLFKLEIDDRAYLVWSIIPHSCFYSTTELKSFWVFHPVITYFPQTTDNLDFDPPFYLRLKEVSYSENEINAINLENNKPIRACITKKKEDINLLAIHNSLVSSSSKKVKDIYLHLLKTELFNENAKFLYHECWT